MVLAGGLYCKPPGSIDQTMCLMAAKKQRLHSDEGTLSAQAESEVSCQMSAMQLDSHMPLGFYTASHSAHDGHSTS